MAIGRVAISPKKHASAASDNPLLKEKGPASKLPVDLRITNAKTAVIITGDSRIERPRGVRSASRSCASATAEVPGDSPGSARPHAALVGTARRAPVDPGDSRTLAKANMLSPCSTTTVTVNATRPAAADAVSPPAATRVDLT